MVNHVIIIGVYTDSVIGQEPTVISLTIISGSLGALLAVTLVLCGILIVVIAVISIKKGI